jgi:hypothetical protein
MSHFSPQRMTVHAHAEELLPKFGVVWLRDELDRTWTVTRATAGPGLERLRAGQPLRLEIAHSTVGALVVSYTIVEGCGRS